jgi:8-oxo-dGTP pyrophosphatase MutT (NUDIX family)
MYSTEGFGISLPKHEGAMGVYSPEDVIVESGEPMRRETSDIDLFEEMHRRAKDVPNWTKFRLSGYEESPEGKLVLRLGLTDYHEFMGTNVAAGKDSVYMRQLVDRGLEKFGDPDAFFSNTLAMTSTLKTSDRRVVVGLRSDKPHEYKRCWHSIGGHPDPEHYRESEPDMFDSMAREIEGESGITRDEIVNMRLSGLMTNSLTRKPELLFIAETPLSFDELKKRRGYEKDEHFAFFGIDADVGLIRFLKENQTEFTFPQGSGLNLEEQKELRPREMPANTTNFFVPSGEASWILYLAHQGVDVLSSLPYVRKTL